MNFESVCRTCLKSMASESLVALYQVNEETIASGTVTIVALLRLFTKIRISVNDGYSQKICVVCFANLLRTYAFKLKCENNDYTLQTMQKSVITFKNYDVICRICLLQSPALYPLFDGNIELLRYFTQITILPGNQSPHNICANCIDEIKNACIFKYQCEDAEAESIQTLNEINIKKEYIKQQMNETSEIKMDDVKTEDNIIVQETYETYQPEIKQERDDVLETVAQNRNDLEVFVKNESNENNASGNEEESQIQKVLLGDLFEITEIGESSRHNETLNELEYGNEIVVDNDQYHDISRFFVTEADNANETNYQVVEISDSIRYLVDDQLNESNRDDETNESHLVKTEDISTEYLDESDQDEETDEQKNLLCPACNEVLSSQKELTKHLLKNHTVGNYCTICNQAFRTNFIRKHCAHYHKSVVIVIRTEYSEEFTPKPQLELHRNEKCRILSYKCKGCGQNFDQPSQKRTHEKLHKNGLLPLDAVEEMNGQKCSICSQIFPSRLDTLDHMVVHCRQRLHICKICLKTFFLKQLLKVHINTEHSKMGLYQCKHCPRSFKRFDYLTGHAKTHQRKRKLSKRVRAL